MKFAAYMAWILLKTCKFSDKIYYNYGDNEFFQRDVFVGAPYVCHTWCIQSYHSQHLRLDVANLEEQI